MEVIKCVALPLIAGYSVYFVTNKMLARYENIVLHWYTIFLSAICFSTVFWLSIMMSPYISNKVCQIIDTGILDLYNECIAEIQGGFVLCSLVTIVLGLYCVIVQIEKRES